MIKLFVYGSLKRGFERNGILENQKLIGQVRTKALFLLYNCGTFPAMVRCAAGKEIVGELWEIDESLIPVLDRIEGSPHLYKMEEIALSDGQLVQCYLFQKNPKLYDLKECGVEWR